MTLLNIECQIATVLMKRFLDGENLPQNLLDDLEQHLKVCPACQALVQDEKTSLEEVLDGRATPKQGVAAWMHKVARKPATASGFVTAHPAEALLHASQTTYTTNPSGLAAFKNPKVLFLSLALAAVLVAMSTVLRDPTAFLGPKAKPSASTSAASTPAESTAEDNTDDPNATEKTQNTAQTQLAATTTEEPSTASTSPQSDDQPTTDPSNQSRLVRQSQPQEQPQGPDDRPADNPGPTTNSAPARQPTSQATNPAPQAPANDPRVPGRPTLDTSRLIVAGGPSASANATPKATTRQPGQNQTASPSASAARQPAPAARPAAPPRRQTANRRSNNRPAQSNRPSQSNRPAQNQRSSSIRVYDPSGKPIN